jgi:hypothetical protein
MARDFLWLQRQLRQQMTTFFIAGMVLYFCRDVAHNISTDTTMLSKLFRLSFVSMTTNGYSDKVEYQYLQYGFKILIFKSSGLQIQTTLHLDALGISVETQNIASVHFFSKTKKVVPEETTYYLIK